MAAGTELADDPIPNLGRISLSEKGTLTSPTQRLCCAHSVCRRAVLTAAMHSQARAAAARLPFIDGRSKILPCLQTEVKAVSLFLRWEVLIRETFLFKAPFPLFSIRQFISLELTAY